MPPELVSSMAVSFIPPLSISLLHLAAIILTDLSMLPSDLFPAILIVLLASAFANNLPVECSAIALLVPIAMILTSFACGHLGDNDAESTRCSGLEQDLHVILGIFDSLYASNTAQLARHLRSEAIAGLVDYVFGPETYVEDIPPPPAPTGPNVDHITEQLLVGIKANWNRYLKDMLVPSRKRFHLLIVDSPPTSFGDPSLVRRTPWSMRATVPVEIVRLLLEKDRPTFEQFQDALDLADPANTFHSFVDNSHLVISTYKGFMVMGKDGFLTLHYNMLHGALDDEWDDSMAIPTIELLAVELCKPTDEAVSQPIEEIVLSTRDASLTTLGRLNGDSSVEGRHVSFSQRVTT